MEKKLYNAPQTEVVALKGNMWVMDTTSIPLPIDMGAGAPKKRTQVF